MKTSKYKKIELDTLEIRIYTFISRKIGYAKRPTNIPIGIINRGVLCTYQQAKDRIQTLTKKGLLEKWTSYKIKEGKLTKENYLRIPYPSEEELVHYNKNTKSKEINE